MSPRIGVALKLTPRRIDVDPLTGSLVPDRAPAAASAAGLAALEIALQLRAAWRTTVTVATMGPDAAEPMLRDALARGADLAVRVPVAQDQRCGAPGLPSAIAATASALAAALADCPVVLCGDGGRDGTGAVPALLAAHHGRAQALGLIRAEAGEPGVIHAERRLDQGWRERLRVHAPMVISVESAVARPRRATLADVLATRDGEVTVSHAARASAVAGAGCELGSVAVAAYRPRARALPAPAGESPLARVRSLMGSAADHRQPPRQVHDEPAEAARQILEQLRSWGYL